MEKQIIRKKNINKEENNHKVNQISRRLVIIGRKRDNNGETNKNREKNNHREKILQWRK
jgi:hypothetical protein